MGKPISFFDNSWLAVQAGQVQAMTTILDLADATPATWEEGLAAVSGDFYDLAAPGDSYLSRVFVTPEVGGWRLAVGGWLGGGSPGGPSLDVVAGYCRDLSRLYGAAHAFTEQGRMDWFQWILAWGGEVRRLYSWDGETLRVEGIEHESERHFHERASGDPRRTPRIGDVGTIAGQLAVDPESLGEYPPGLEDGVLAVTRWGRQHGVPKRTLL